MSVQVERLEHNMVKLTIEVPAEQFAKACKASYNKQKNSFAVPGFRKGKVPMAMVEKMYGPEIFFDDAVNQCMNDTYGPALDEAGIVPVSRPAADVVSIGKGQAMVYTVEVAVKPEVTLGQYKGVEVAALSAEVTEEDVNAKLEEEQKKQAAMLSSMEVGDYVVTTKPTCQSSGTETKTCSVCGATSSRTIAKLEHNFGTWVVTKEATCIATGTETSTCRECGTTTTRTIAKTEHTFGSWVTVNEATCTQNGLEKSVCSYCKNEITRETEKASHSYVVSSVKDATCTETGYTTHTCKNCGDSYIDSIKEIIDHTDKNNDGVCDNCKAVLGTYCNHDYVITYTAPTCTNAGSIKLVCSLCKKESVTTIDSLDHNYVAFTFEPTCTQDGYTKHYCINCGDEYIDAKVKAPGHQMRVEKIVPTCTQNGCDIVICSDCGYNYETKVVKALGHDDFNRDGKCDICNENLGTPENPSDNCSHICHKAQSGGFYKVIYKILVVFWKLFGTNKTCSCGVKHY